MRTTMKTLTSEQIEALRGEAATAGDLGMADLCTEALSGDDGARDEIVRVIRETEARI